MKKLTTSSYFQRFGKHQLLDIAAQEAIFHLGKIKIKGKKKENKVTDLRKYRRVRTQ